MPFLNRADAGRNLALALATYKKEHPVVLGLARGGIPVAAEIAVALDAPLDAILVRKIGVPSQPELAMGAVVDGEHPIVVRNENVIVEAGVSETDFRAICDRELTEVERRRVRYLGGRDRIEVAGRTVIVVDDGIATGATTRAALQATRNRKPHKLVLAVPVAPTDSLRELASEVDDVVCLEEHEFFFGIGQFYSDFSQVTDEEVIEVLTRCSRPPLSKRRASPSRMTPSLET